ncbi:MAG TPA: galactitol-1-phosphate 5-dehydrogenase [Candidatus Acidoferrales bacterium]|jgi:L-iditol 2-dehydrogenase|nr:galactitol-1-phosphate 5-dehydrogenase [Candidatus Acidoferrales bacterium]
MKALVLKDYRRFAVEDFAVPDLKPDEVLVRVRACGICGSDVHGMDGSSGRRIPPIVMGHEAAGEIAKIGSGVTGWKIGDRVTFDSTIYCGDCWYCRRGAVNLCENRRVLGVSCAEYRRHGAFAEFVAVPQRILYRLPDKLSFEQAAMVEAVSVAGHAVKRTPLAADASTFVVGTGMIGLLVVQMLRVTGCKRIIAIDLDESRLALADKFGATQTFNAGISDLPEKIRSLTDGRGADAAFEVVGLPQTVKTAITCVRKGGSVTLVGNLKPQVDLPLQSVVTRELSLIGTCASAGEYPACLDLIASGQIDVTGFISATAPLEEGAQWFERLYAGERGLMKVLLKP